jgi:transposase
MGPMIARGYPGREPIYARAVGGEPAGRARQQLDYKRTEKRGYVFGAFKPATGEALTATYTSRSISNFVGFLKKVEAWVPRDVGRIYVILDNLRAHKAQDVLLFNLAHPRWEFVFQPKYAAYLNLIEPWWKTLKSLALKGRRFGSWEEIETAVRKALDYWNEHRHPYVWGRRRRHRPARSLGVAAMPRVASVSQ